MSRPALRHLPILALAFANALLSAAPELVTVGDPGNPGHETAFDNSRYSPQPGAVGHPYRIAKREVSNADYAAFLNAHATSKDPHQFFDERMKITRTGVPGAWRYAASPGSDNDGVAFVSRTNAARYCNFLTTGDPGRGPYKVEKRIRENGKTHDAIVGFRDLTFLDEARIYSLPDMHEFYKAGWYDGAGAYRKISTETRHAPSHYGLENHASGLREWIDNKYRNGATFALGASDSDTSAAANQRHLLLPHSRIHRQRLHRLPRHCHRSAANRRPPQPSQQLFLAKRKDRLPAYPTRRYAPKPENPPRPA